MVNYMCNLWTVEAKPWEAALQKQNTNNPSRKTPGLFWASFNLSISITLLDLSNTTGPGRHKNLCP